VKLYAGVDGGQSSTVAAIGDGERELARAAGPPADLVGLPRDAARQAGVIGTTVAAALARAGLDPALRLAGLVAGISGFDRGESPEPDLGACAERFAVVHDAEIAHAGALGGAAGIVAIAGTGSVALGTASPGNAFVRAGGWGFFFGDEGSALWIARTALRAAMDREDRGHAGALATCALAFFAGGGSDIHSLRSIQHAFAHGELTRPTLAAFASEVLALAERGDPDAGSVRAAAYDALAQLVATVDARLAPAAGRRISYAGGLFLNAPFAAGFRGAVERRVPGAVVASPAGDAAAGALALARRLAGALPGLAVVPE
jgi:N-acetylglucosamine kinase-like BadF-type ATPase